MENRLPDYFEPSIMIVLSGTLAYFVITMLRPKALVEGFAGAMTVIILVAGLWPEETARESMRKPYIAGQYVYSNQIISRDVPGMDIKSQLPTIEKVGILKAHPFTPEHLKTINDGNKIQAGQYIAMVYCSNCHSPSKTGIRPLHRYFPDDVTYERMEKYVKGVLTTGNIAYMPKMPLKDDEAEALAAYLLMNNSGGMSSVSAAIEREVENRDRALAAEKTDDQVASFWMKPLNAQEVK